MADHDQKRPPGEAELRARLTDEQFRITQQKERIVRSPAVTCITRTVRNPRACATA